jgi:hypothetical protein
MMSSVGEWTWELIICLLYVLKNDFDEFYEAIYRGVERPYELIFCFLRIKKIDLDENA